MDGRVAWRRGRKKDRGEGGAVWMGEGEAAVWMLPRGRRVTGEGGAGRWFGERRERWFGPLRGGGRGTIAPARGKL